MRIETFIPNEPDGEHCWQAVYRMSVEALTGSPVSLHDAEVATGYMPGRDTWQFRALLSFAELGFEVTDCENFDAKDFVADPVAVIRKQVGDDAVAQQVLDETDLDAEVAAVKACLAHKLVTFSNKIPQVADVRQELSIPGTMMLCNINSKKLAHEEGHRGHLVIVEELRGNIVRIENPGPPAARGQEVDVEDFERAWMDPSPSMANYISVRKPR